MPAHAGIHDFPSQHSRNRGYRHAPARHGRTALAPPLSVMIPAAARAFLESNRIGHLATADARAEPHVVPVCFACTDTTLYITIDAKPKGSAARLKRLRNIIANPQATFITDRYNEDWSQLGWVMLRGTAEILDAGAEHDRAQALLRVRYSQYRAMPIEALPVIALRIARVTTWGNLAVS
jgi:PPOX class probable F420-dependent enzyme